MPESPKPRRPAFAFDEYSLELLTARGIEVDEILVVAPDGTAKALYLPRLPPVAHDPRPGTITYRVIAIATTAGRWHRYASSLHASLAEAIEALVARQQEACWDSVALTPMGR